MIIRDIKKLTRELQNLPKLKKFPMKLTWILKPMKLKTRKGNGLNYLLQVINSFFVAALATTTANSCIILEKQKTFLCEGDYSCMIDSLENEKNFVIRNAIFEFDYEDFYKIAKDSILVNTLYYRLPFENIPKEILYSSYVLECQGKKYEYFDFYALLDNYYESFKEKIPNNKHKTEYILQCKTDRYLSNIRLSKSGNNKYRLKIIQQNTVNPYLIIDLNIPFACNNKIILNKLCEDSYQVFLTVSDIGESIAFNVVLKKSKEGCKTILRNVEIRIGDIVERNKLNVVLTPQNATQMFNKFLNKIVSPSPF